MCIRDRIDTYDKIIFSYHGIPNSHVDNVYPDSMCADHNCEMEVTQDNKFCYKATTYETTKILAKKLNIPDDKYIVTYQSRLTNKWLSPFTDEVLESLPKDDKKNVLVFSPAFTADCLETIIEIGDEYKELFDQLKKFEGEKIFLPINKENYPDKEYLITNYPKYDIYGLPVKYNKNILKSIS